MKVKQSIIVSNSSILAGFCSVLFICIQDLWSPSTNIIPPIHHHAPYLHSWGQPEKTTPTKAPTIGVLRPPDKVLSMLTAGSGLGSWQGRKTQFHQPRAMEQSHDLLQSSRWFWCIYTPAICQSPWSNYLETRSFSLRKGTGHDVPISVVHLCHEGDETRVIEHKQPFFMNLPKFANQNLPTDFWTIFCSPFKWVLRKMMVIHLHLQVSCDFWVLSPNHWFACIPAELRLKKGVVKIQVSKSLARNQVWRKDDFVGFFGFSMILLADMKPSWNPFWKDISLFVTDGGAAEVCQSRSSDHECFLSALLTSRSWTSSSHHPTSDAKRRLYFNSPFHTPNPKNGNHTSHPIRLYVPPH